mgnify:CR=1 FL=1
MSRRTLAARSRAKSPELFVDSFGGGTIQPRARFSFMCRTDHVQCGSPTYPPLVGELAVSRGGQGWARWISGTGSKLLQRQPAARHSPVGRWSLSECPQMHMSMKSPPSSMAELAAQHSRKAHAIQKARRIGKLTQAPQGAAPRKSRPSGAAMPQTSGWGAGEVAINTVPPAWHRQCSFGWRKRHRHRRRPPTGVSRRTSTSEAWQIGRAHV